MSSLLVALPVICCLLIPAAIYVAALVFRRPGKQSLHRDGQIKDLTHPIERDLRNWWTVPVVRLTNPKAQLAPEALIALILISIAVLTACGGDTSGSAPGGAANNAGASAVSQPSSGVPVVSLTMDDYLGSTVVLYFSFPGWPTCGLEAPALGRVQEEFQSQGVQVLAINTAPWIPVEDWRDYWRSKGAEDVSWANDVDQQLLKTFKVTSLGTTIIIDRQGRVSYRDSGATSYEVLRTEIEKTLWGV